MARAKDRLQYNLLVAAVKDYFRRNIGSHDILRHPDRLGSLKDFPELEDATRLSLTPDIKERRGMERTR